jgi:arylformamidase
MMYFKNIYDISITLGLESIDHPGATPYSRRLIWEIGKGRPCNLSEIVMTTHTGTHVDAPSHFVPGGQSIGQYSAREFIFRAHVICIEDEDSIKREHLASFDFERGDALLFRTLNSVRGISRSGKFSKDYIALSPEAAELCALRKVGLVGIDYVTIDKYGDKSFSAHVKLLQNDVLILEGIDLMHVPEGKYTLLCIPLKIEGAEASPVRALLFC